MVEAPGALLAAGAHQDVRRVLSYLQATQQSDGHWSQNVVGWLTVLDRDPNGRDGSAHSPGGLSQTRKGTAIGIASFVAPLYISEIAPVDIRGKLVAVNQVSLTKRHRHFLID
jgi:hypothetical protein